MCELSNGLLQDKVLLPRAQEAKCGDAKVSAEEDLLASCSQGELVSDLVFLKAKGLRYLWDKAAARRGGEGVRER